MYKVDRVFIFTLPCWSVDTQFFPSAIIRGTTCGLLLTLMYHFCSVSWFSSLVYLPAIIRWEQFEWDLIHVKRTVITYFLEGGGGGRGGRGWWILFVSRWNLYDPILRFCNVIVISPRWRLVGNQSPILLSLDSVGDDWSPLRFLWKLSEPPPPPTPYPASVNND